MKIVIPVPPSSRVTAKDKFMRNWFDYLFYLGQMKYSFRWEPPITGRWHNLCFHAREAWRSFCWLMET